jgi:hypothetical protein
VDETAELQRASDHPIAPDVGSRVTAVIASAEDAASAIRREAEQYAERRRKEADQLVADRLSAISELSDEIAARAEALLQPLEHTRFARERLEELLVGLGEAAAGLGGREGTAALTGNGGGSVSPRASRSARGGRPDEAIGARDVALQMARVGGTRAEVEGHLHRAFDLDEPGPILDDIFGSGSNDRRMAPAEPAAVRVEA